MSISCEECGKTIPKERLKALPGTLTCVGCSQVKPWNENTLYLDGTSIAEMNGVMTGNETMGNSNSLDKPARRLG